MRLSLTTIFGLLGAISLAVSQVTGLSVTAHLICVCISAACVAGLGYHAADQTPRPPLPPLTCFLLLLVCLIVCCCGCKVGGFGVELKSPAFGSVGVSLDGGVIGKGQVPTNAPSPVLAP